MDKILNFNISNIMALMNSTTFGSLINDEY